MEKFALDVVYDRDTVWQYFDIKTTDSLLSRNWFYHTQDIVDVLNSADEDAWAYIYKHRSKYSPNIRQLIEPNDYRIHSNLRVVELTDIMMFRMEKERKDQCMADWIQEIKNISPRPHDETDRQLRQAHRACEDAKKSLSDYLEKQTKKYKSPMAKLLVDPKQKALEESIVTLKNEFEKANDIVISENMKYLEEKRRDFESSWKKQPS
jgi:hypothetical protein